MSTMLKSVVVAAAAAAWAAVVHYVGASNSGVFPDGAWFANLLSVVLSAVVPAVIALFMKSPKA